jgi:DNA modification methylase
MSERVSNVPPRREVITGDCLDVMRTLGTQYDCIITDPPYGTEGPAGGYGRRQLYGGGKFGRRIANDTDLSQLAGMLALVPEVLRPDAYVIAWASPKMRGKVDREFERANLSYVGEYVWEKGMPGLGVLVRYQHETALIFARGNPKPQEPLISVTRVSAERVSAGDEHPHRKPPEVMRRLIRFACPRNGSVLDPFAGCGPVGEACVMEGRDYTGIEIEATYAIQARTRIARREGAPQFFGAGA